MDERNCDRSEKPGVTVLLLDRGEGKIGTVNHRETKRGRTPGWDILAF